MAGEPQCSQNAFLAVSRNAASREENGVSLVGRRLLPLQGFAPSVSHEARMIAPRVCRWRSPLAVRGSMKWQTRQYPSPCGPRIVGGLVSAGSLATGFNFKAEAAIARDSVRFNVYDEGAISVPDRWGAGVGLELL